MIERYSVSITILIETKISPNSTTVLEGKYGSIQKATCAIKASKMAAIQLTAMFANNEQRTFTVTGIDTVLCVNRL